MKAVMKKAGEIALSALLVSLVCLPIPAMSAFAEDMDGEPQQQTEQESELTPEQLLKLKKLQEAEAEKAAAAPEVEAKADADAPTPTDETKTDDSAATDTDANSEKEAADSDDTAGSDDVTGDEKATEPTADDDTTTTVPTTDQPANDTATDAAKAIGADAATVSTADELKVAFVAANAHAGSGAYTIALAANIDLSEGLSVAAGKNVTIEGDGHMITLDGTASFTVNGTLTLDSSLTIQASASQTGSLINVSGGTLNMNSGVTLEGNGIVSALLGGGVSLTNKATFNMNGGTIENCGASQGGGVYVSSSTFNMSGDATIQNCQAYSGGTKNGGDGGGVYMEIAGRTSTAQMTMSGNASIRNNTASSTGGGVQLETRTTLTMEGNASIVDNSAHAAGGVMNYGMATLTTVYNNTSRAGAADIFNMAGARLKLSPVNPDWVHKTTGTHVTGWYTDNYSSTDEDGNQADGGHRWMPDDEASVEYVPTNGFTTQALHLIAGSPLPHVKVIWENEDGTVLYQEEVKTGEVPAADEYADLSGNAEPTEPDTADGQVHEFTGWMETHPSDDEVVYIANYKLVDPQHDETLVDEDPTPTRGDDPATPTPDDDDPTTPAVADPTNGNAAPKQAGTYSGTSAENTSVAGAALQQTGDNTARALTTLAALLGVSVIALSVAESRKREQ